MRPSLTARRKESVAQELCQQGFAGQPASDCERRRNETKRRPRETSSSNRQPSRPYIRIYTPDSLHPHRACPAAPAYTSQPASIGGNTQEQEQQRVRTGEREAAHSDQRVCECCTSIHDWSSLPCSVKSPRKRARWTDERWPALEAQSSSREMGREFRWDRMAVRQRRGLRQGSMARTRASCLAPCSPCSLTARHTLPVASAPPCLIELECLQHHTLAPCCSRSTQAMAC